MTEPFEFRVVEGAAQTLLHRSFDADVEVVFDAWTNPEMLKKWWGPHGATVVECRLDLREGGAHRITLRMPDDRDYPMYGTVHDVVLNQAFSLAVQLDQHPEDWRELFRPQGTELGSVPMEWYYQVSFRPVKVGTAVELLVTYPVMDDRDRFVAMHGEFGWMESFEKLDVQLAHL